MQKMKSEIEKRNTIKDERKLKFTKIVKNSNTNKLAKCEKSTKMERENEGKERVIKKINRKTKKNLNTSKKSYKSQQVL